MVYHERTVTHPSTNPARRRPTTLIMPCYTIKRDHHQNWVSRKPATFRLTVRYSIHYIQPDSHQWLVVCHRCPLSPWQRVTPPDNTGWWDRAHRVIKFLGCRRARGIFNAQWRTKCAVINWICAVTKGCLCSDKIIYQGMKMFRSKDPQTMSIMDTVHLLICVTRILYMMAFIS